jgi:nitroimidazol reductase NimA-like FMN-containing flavoprotein (pyridoxamine 5'-phosphate oxidase superfamily)
VHEPQELPYATCRGLLASGVVGRAAICTPSGPRIFTVNYSVVDEAILFRTTPYSVLGTYAWKSPLAFQVDNLNYEYQRGWSVLATGRGQAVEDAEELQHIRAVWEPRPWAAGTRQLYVRLAWDELSGRQLGLGWDPKSDLPVRRTV